MRQQLCVELTLRTQGGALTEERRRQLQCAAESIALAQPITGMVFSEVEARLVQALADLLRVQHAVRNTTA